MTPLFCNILCAASQPHAQPRRTTVDYYGTLECPDKDVLIIFSDSGSFSQKTLNSVNPYHLPPELWAHIFLFFSSKQELVPLQQVSRLFKICANAALVHVPYQTLDYRSLIEEGIKSYRVGKRGFEQLPFIILSSGVAVTVEKFYDLCFFDLKNCQSMGILSTLFPEKKSLVIPHTFMLFHFKKNIIITNSYHLSSRHDYKLHDYKLHVWDVEKSTPIQTLMGNQSPFDSLAKLNDSLVASISRDGAVKIWDIEKGECTKEIPTKKCDTKPSIVRLAQENSLLITTENSIACLNLDSWDFVAIGKGNIHSVHVYSDDQVIVNYGAAFTIVKNMLLFDYRGETLEYVRCPHGGGFSNIRVLPDGNIAFLTIRNPETNFVGYKENWGYPIHVLGIYDVNRKEFILSYDLDTRYRCDMELVEDGRIAIRMTSWGSETIEIFPFAKKDQ